MSNKLDSSNFDGALAGTESIYAVRFSATWCGPCKAMSPIFKEVSEELAGSVEFGEVDIDESTEIASRCGVQGIPAVLLFKDGQMIDKVVGVTRKPDFIRVLTGHIA